MALPIFGLAEAAIKLTEERTSILADNIANASTPNYKARDIDFHKILKDYQDKAQSTTNNDEINSLTKNVTDNQLLYRVPMQTSLDGNTVDDNIERANFLQNSLRYQLSLTYIQTKSTEIEKALSGA